MISIRHRQRSDGEFPERAVHLAATPLRPPAAGEQPDSQAAAFLLPHHPEARCDSARFGRCWCQDALPNIRNALEVHYVSEHLLRAFTTSPSGAMTTTATGG